MLSKAVHERPFEWEDHIRRLCLAYNSSVNQTTGHTPFYLMFGWQVRMPVDLMYGHPTLLSTTVPQYVADVRSNLTAAYEQVRATMSTKLGHQKELYDCRVHGEPFKPGDLVWLHSPAVPRGQSRKLHFSWTGPYRVTNRLSDAVYRIQHCQSRCKRLVVHFDRLKRCSPDTRLPPAAPNQQQPSNPPSIPPPVGTDLELVEACREVRIIPKSEGTWCACGSTQTMLARDSNT